MESKKYSWAWVTVDQVLCQGPCELLFAHLVPSSATTDSVIYAGQNTKGDVIVTLKDAAVTGLDFRPAAPVYSDKGLYVDVGTNVSGIFVQWRDLKGGE